MTLRSVNASSWLATGLIELAWKRLTPPTRDELARITGVSGSNLSGMNKGRIPLTPTMAARIALAVPGITPADLGAPESVVAAIDPSVLDRLESLAGRVEYLLGREADLTRELGDARTRLALLEKRRKPPGSGPKHQEGKS